MQKIKWQCRWSPTLGSLEESHESVWGTEVYNQEVDNRTPTVFFGLYGLPDFWVMWRHKGRKAILWAGSDIIHFINGYWLDGEGGIRISPQGLAHYINTHCENYVENIAEHDALLAYGIRSQIVPSFLGDVSKYEVSYEQAEVPKVYLSSSEGRQEEYGWGIIESIADSVNCEFHLYGATHKTKHPNVIVHGRVSKEQMNEEIKKMQCGLRLNEFDGFSEVTCKSVLWGQWPITRIPNPEITSFKTVPDLVNQLNELKNIKEPNPARNYYLKNLNNYPWNTKS